MTLPDTATPVLPDLGANQEGSPRDRYLSARILAAGAHRINDVMHLGLSGSRIRKLVRRFVDEGRSDIDLHTYLMTHADPTGETAVRNVMRGGHRDRP